MIVSLIANQEVAYGTCLEWQQEQIRQKLPLDCIVEIDPFIIIGKQGEAAMSNNGFRIVWHFLSKFW